jgi:hypothetical protein
MTTADMQDEIARLNMQSAELETKLLAAQATVDQYIGLYAQLDAMVNSSRHFTHLGMAGVAAMWFLAGYLAGKLM